MSNAKAARKNYPDTNEAALENDILKIAVAHINLRVFVYDSGTKILRFIDKQPPPLGLPRVVTNPTIYMWQQGDITPECADTLRDLFERSLSGIEKVSAIIEARRDPDHDDLRWYNIVLINCFDETGSVLRVVGTIQDVTDRVTAEIRYTKEEQFRLAMMADNRRVYEINVTRDRFMRLESMDDSTDRSTWLPYTETMSAICRNQVYREDWDCFLKVATRVNLLEAFKVGQSEFYCEYRLDNGNGDLSWSSSTTHLLSDPASGEVKGFIYAKDIDAQKKQELLLRQQAERDPLTDIYNRAAAERLIEDILTNSGPDHLHGFLSIDVDDFKTVNDTFGHLQGDVLLQQIAGGFSKILRSNDVLARMGGDEFIVFLTDVNSIGRIHSVAKRLCGFVHTLCLSGIDEIHFSISIGIATYPHNGSSFPELYKYSDAALYFAKQNGKNRISSEF